MKKLFWFTVLVVAIAISKFETTGQTSIVEYHTVRLSPDHEMVAGAAYNRTTVEFRLRLWDGQSGETLIDLQGNTAPVVDFAWSPDSKRLIGADGNFNVIVWCTDQTHVDCTFGSEITRLQGIEDGVDALDWYSDGILATVSRYGGSALRTWNMNTYTVIDSYDAGEMIDVAWSPDGSQIATASYYGNVIVFDRDLSTHHEVTPANNEVTVFSIAWDQTGSRIAYGMLDGTIVVADSETGQELARLEQHDYAATALAWSPDNTQLATASSMGTVIVWNPTTNVAQVVAVIEKQQVGTASIVWMPDGTLLYPDATDFPVGLPTPTNLKNE